MYPIEIARLGGLAAELQHLDLLASGSHLSGGATASLFVSSTLIGGSGVSSYKWLFKGAVTNFEFLATIISAGGMLTSGTFGSWVAADTAPSWSMSKSSIGDFNGSITLQVRAKGTTNILSTCTVTFECQVS